MKSFIKKLFKRGETDKSIIDPLTTQIDPTEGLEYIVVRTLTFDKRMGDDSYNEDKRKLNELVNKLRVRIHERNVIIIHSPSKRAIATANELQRCLISEKIGVASCVPTNLLSIECSSYCNDPRLKTIVKDLVNGHYIVYITHEMNLQNYGLKEYKMEKFFPLAGQGITHDGKII